MAVFGLNRSAGQSWLLSRPLCLSALPDGAGLFWNTEEEVTITEGAMSGASTWQRTGSCFTLAGRTHFPDQF